MINEELLSRGVDVGKELVSQGAPVKFAAAMAGNAMLESGARTIAPSRDGSDGLWQWRDAANVSRLTRLKQFAVHHAADWRDLKIQCSFALYECANDFPALWAMRDSDKSVATLTLDWCDIFERPAASGRVPDTRIAYAEAVSKELSANETLQTLPKQASPKILTPVSLPQSIIGENEMNALVAILTPVVEKVLPEILPVLAPVLGKIAAPVIKELEASYPGLVPIVKTICDDISAAL